MDNTAFIKAILDDPDDDAPRLIYADFLEEQGQPSRAELIRVQCAIAGPCCAGVDNGRNCTQECDDHKALKLREAELLRWCHSWPRFGGYAVAPATYNPAIIKLFPPSGGPEIANVAFRRGFIRDVSMTGDSCLEHLDDILACQPVEEVTLTSMPCRTPVPWVTLRNMTSNSRYVEFSAIGGPWLGLINWHGSDSHRPVVQTAVMARWPSVRRWVLPFPCRPFPPERFPQ